MTSLDLSATSLPHASRLSRPLLLLAWIGIAAALILLRGPDILAYGPLDTDSLMRLAEVRDYLAGQAWTDLHQMRMNAPDGIVMHWSRLIDWPIAALIRLFEPLRGRAFAETAAMVLWPPLLFGPFMAGIVSIARRIAGRDATLPAVAFAVFAAPAFATFSPGDIDHHNAQLVGFVLMLAMALRLDRGQAFGVAAGLIAATMLAIGLETLPAVAATGALIAVAWAVKPSRFAPATAGFGLAFAAAMVAHRLAAAAPAEWFAATCDIASYPYVAASVVAGLGLAALARAAPMEAWQRFGGLAILGLAAGAVLLMIAPACLRGPYAEIDPRIVPLWLGNVAEAQTLAGLAATAPSLVPGLIVAPLIAFFAGLVGLIRAERQDRFAWSLLLVLMVVAIGITVWQARGATFAAALAAPILAWLVVAARRAGARRGPIAGSVLLVAAYIVPNQYLHTVLPEVPGYMAAHWSAWSGRMPAGDGPAAATSAAGGGWRDCAKAPSFEALAALPPGVVLSPTNLGPSIVAHTPHGAVAGPYHRNANGILDAFEAFGGSTESAREIVLRRRAAYVLVCPGDDETQLIRAKAPGGFLDQLSTGAVPEWLTPVASHGPLKLWIVNAARADAPLPAIGELRGAL